jgi:hypothetical protein
MEQELRLRHVLPAYGTTTPTRDTLCMYASGKASRVVAAIALAADPARFRRRSDTPMTH